MDARFNRQNKEQHWTHLGLAKSQIKSSVDWAAVGSMVISGREVSGGASGITSTADGLGASGALARRHDGEAELGELVVASLHVNARHVPEDGVTGLGVLELEDIVLLGVKGQFDGDATAVGVGAPCLGVDATTASDGLHGANVAGNGPGVDILCEVVGDRDTAAVSANHLAADHVLGKSRGDGGEEGGKAKSLSEHHIER